jgi:hypothetical protein
MAQSWQQARATLTGTTLHRTAQAEYSEYRKVKAKRTEFIHAKQNADVILYRQQEHYDRTREK